MKATKHAPAPERPVKTDRNGFVRCRVCGCTEVEACVPACSWAVGEPDLCTTCRDTALEMVGWFYAAHRPNLAALICEYKRIATNTPIPYKLAQPSGPILENARKLLRGARAQRAKK